MSATREAWESGPPDDARFAPPGAYQQREQVPALPGSVPDGQLTNAIGEMIGGSLVQMVAPTALPAKPSANIAARVAQVMREIGFIEKRGRNEFHKFNYATIDDIRAAVGKLCGEAGLVWRQTEMRIFPLGKMLGVTYQFTLSAIDEPETEGFPTVVTVLTSIMSNKGGLDDKAFSKARALAWKDWAKSQFAIPTGEDPDEHDPDASHGAPRDAAPPPARNSNGKGGAPAGRQDGPPPAPPVPAKGTAWAYLAGDGQTHVSDTPEEWEQAWMKRVRAFVMATRLDDLRAAFRQNGPHIDASGENGTRVKEAILDALNGGAPPASTGTTGGTDTAAGAAAEQPPPAAEVKAPEVKRSKDPDGWVKNMAAAVFKCDSLAMLNALVIREKATIDLLQKEHPDLHAQVSRAVIDRRVALENATKAAGGQ